MLKNIENPKSRSMQAVGLLLALLAFCIPGQADLIVFKNHTVIDQAQITGRKGDLFTLQWQDQNFYVRQKYVEKSIDQSELAANPGVLDGYTHSTEYQFPTSPEEFRKLIPTETPLTLVDHHPISAASGNTQPADDTSVILFKNKVIIENAKLLSRQGSIISMRWQKQTFFMNVKYFDKVVEPQVLADNPKLLDGYRRSGEYQFPVTFAELKKMVTMETAYSAENPPVFGAAAGWSQNPADVEGKFGVFGNLGYEMFALGDVNQFILTPINDEMAAIHASGSLSSINGGGEGGGGLQYGVTSNLLVGAELDYVGASSKATFTLPTGESMTYDYSFPLLSLGVFAKGAWPLTDRLLLTGGLGLDYLSMSGTIKATDYRGVTTQLNASGSGVGFKLSAGGQYFFTGNFSVGLDLGYRFAPINTIKDSDNNTLQVGNPARDMKLDYSGFFTHVGLNLYFGGAKQKGRFSENQPLPARGQGEGVSGAGVLPTQTLGTPSAQNAAPGGSRSDGKASKNSLSSKLRELKKLADDGLITPEEYNQQKSKLLDKYSNQE
jgi:opacity protein-like surface antigen